MKKLFTIFIILFFSLNVLGQALKTIKTDNLAPNSSIGTSVDVGVGLTVNSSAVIIDDLLDEDTLVSDSATALATQQSIKAYVDASGGLNSWLTATVYIIDDVVWEPASDKIYRCTTGHTSGVFLTDIANWTELSSVPSLTTGSVVFAGATGELSEDNTNLFWNDTDNTLGVGQSSNSFTIAGAALTSKLTIDTEGVADLLGVVSHRHSDTAGFGSHIMSLRSRGTHAAEAAVQSGDSLLRFMGGGFDGTDYERAAEITFNIDGTPGANDMPGNMIFSTTLDGANAPTERMRIDNAGNIGIGKTPTELLDVNGSIAGEGAKILGNTPYKQFNQKAYAEYSVVGDFTTGQNATFDGGGTATATPTIITGALDTTDVKYFQYTMGAVNDYFYLTIPTDENKTIGYRFRYSYDGDNNDLDLEIKCTTSGTILTDTSPMPVKANTLTTMQGSITIPSGCGSLKLGFSVATFNSGKIFKFNRVALSDKIPKANLTVIQEYKITQAGSALTNATSEIEYNLATATIITSGPDLIVASDDSANTRTKFIANKKLTVHITYTNKTTSGDDYATIYKNGVSYKTGNDTTGASRIVEANAPMELEAGEYFSVGVDSGSVVTSDGILAELVFVVYANAEHVLLASEKREEWIAFTPSVTGLGTIASAEGYYRRVGDSMEVRGTFTTGTPTAVAAYITIPNGQSIDFSKLITDASNNRNKLGNFYRIDSIANFDNNTVAHEGLLHNNGSTSGDETKLYLGQTASSDTSIAQTLGTGIVNAGESITFNFTVPILGWSGANQYYVLVPNDGESKSARTTIPFTAVTTDPTKGTITSDIFSYSKVGRYLNVHIDYLQTAAGSAGSGTYLIDLPDGLSFDTTSITPSTNVEQPTVIGHGVASLGTNERVAQLVAYDSNSMAISIQDTVSGHSFVSSSNFGFNNTTVRISLWASIPIQGWAVSTGVVPGTFAKIRVAYVKDQQAATTNGGTFTSGSFVTRTLNDVTGDTDIVSLASDVFTLQPGKYIIEWSAPAYDVDQHLSRLYRTTPSTGSVLDGTRESSTSTASDQTRSFGETTVDITVATSYRIEHRCGTTSTTNNGLGIGNASLGATNNYYTTVKITQILAR